MTNKRPTKETPEETEVCSFLKENGFAVSSITPTIHKTPDFLIKDRNGFYYLLEIKSRHDSEIFMQELQLVRSGRQRAVGRSRAIGHDRNAKDIIHEAYKQLREKDPTHRYFWFVWLTISERFSHEATYERFMCTLYGIVQIVHWINDKETAVSNCFYAIKGAFERWPGLDGAVISSRAGLSLCLNEFSPRASKVHELQLTKLFDEHSGLVKPRAMKGVFIVEDSTIDRRNRVKLIQYLRDRYNLLDPRIADFRVYSGVSLVQNK